MSKYVKHKHGLNIGSDNWFFVWEESGVRDGYKAILSADDYDFDMVNSVSVFVQTPAQQVMWIRTETEDFHHVYNLSGYIRGWLNTNVGPYQEAWDTYSQSVARSERTLFFKRRKDALALARHIDHILKGIKLP